ncbi:YggS family pyridoxal phosphate-dependent enzyme [Lutimonas saemankumensis]|uniref:YggS family pyridoxal phosphate-dependent enzyme n=1 Tax=Lutimonas saemankumensis TaxID=483016 RepID=UPI001CD465BF|nr:YggS family pyridoxal phosphate-dependent enzyme [Lutimonas saemankumensis]MCA0931960.1 YggS family pyridoxal phosphate-dependent enzyme [Lutimonas saemankumensis]
MFVKENLNNFKETLPSHVSLVAVSKTKPVSDIRGAYEAGHRIFGENKIQEMVNKHEVLPEDIEWHMIGHLQRNKVKYMAHFVSLIHGVDSLKTLKEIDKQAKKHDRVINCLLQAKIAREETKFGLTFDEVKDILKSEELAALTHVKVKGLMGMASFSTDQKVISDEFKSLKRLFDELNKEGQELEILSMGMSGDYKLAIEHGSNMIRVGSAIFGPRNYIAS